MIYGSYGVIQDFYGHIIGVTQPFPPQNTLCSLNSRLSS